MTQMELEAMQITLDETMVTVCCGAQTTYHDTTLICKKCFEEVAHDELVDCGLWDVLEQNAIDSYLDYTRFGE